MEPRNIGFNVQTRNTEEWLDTFQRVSELVSDLGRKDQYVSVWSSSSDPQVENVDDSGATYDEGTLLRFHATLSYIFKDQPNPDDFACRVIKMATEAGFLFRERAK